MRWSAIVLGLPFLLCAQIQDLATTADGSQVYFSTNYRQKGTTQPGYSKIFRMDSNGLALFRQFTLSYPFPNISDPNFYLAELPSVSSDGSAVGYTQARTCEGGSHCIGFIFDQGILVKSTDQILGPGTITVSPDGHSYLLSDYSSNVPPAITLSIGDVVAGNPVTLKGYSTFGRQSLANGHIALVVGANGPVLWKAGQLAPLSLKPNPVQGRLDAAGDMIVYETASPGANFELHSYAVSSGKDVLLATGGRVPTFYGEYPPDFLSSLTLDGKYVSYRLNDVLFVASTDGTNATALTSPADGSVVDAVIAGSGNVVFAATSTGRLLRIDVATGSKTEWIASVPKLVVTGGAAVPGARLDVTMNWLATGDPALVGAGSAAPVVGRSGSTVTLQIPWEAQPLSTVQLVLPSNPSLLEEANDLTLQAGEPAFYTLPSRPNVYTPYALAAHEDFSGIVSVGSPALPGETVHFYFTGLGAVAPAIATGAVTPAGTLYRLQTPPFTCQFQQGRNTFAAEILFAGLAPGLIGVEQVDMRVPAQAVAPAVQIDCVSQQAIGYFEQYAQLPISR